MKRKFIKSTFLLFFITMLSCQRNVYDHVDKPINTIKDRTIIFYMTADNALSEFLNQDIEEIKLGIEAQKMLIDNNNIVIYIENIATLICLKKNHLGHIYEKEVTSYSGKRHLLNRFLISEVLSESI